MVGRKVSPADDSHILRKLRKPMIEKKRRERINNSIDQLKEVLTQSRPEIDYGTRLDKADILELTVNQLSREHRAHVTSHSYNHGFSVCSREIIQYLSARGLLDIAALSRLSTHLQTVSGSKTTNPVTVRVPMKTRYPPHQTFCSTPRSRDVPSFHGNLSMVTTHTTSHSYSSSFNMSTSSADDSYSLSRSDNISSGSESFLGNIVTDEKPWRPW